jgi:hypothetical protein
MRLVVGLLALLFALPARALPLFGSELHPAVVGMPPSAETSIGSVARYVAARELDPLQRVKALHDWVADRIAYDARALVSDVPPEDAYPEDVFKNRKGVCAGYARLLEELGAAIGIPIRTVHGATSEGLHAWNAVNLYGRWYEIDATWDAGTVIGGRFVKEYSTKYFLFTHLPDHGRYQFRAASSDDYSPHFWSHARERLRAQEEPLAHDQAWQAFCEAAEARRAAERENLDWKKLGL